MQRRKTHQYNYEEKQDPIKQQISLFVVPDNKNLKRQIIKQHCFDCKTVVLIPHVLW